MKLNEIFSNDFISRLNSLNKDGHVNPNEEVEGPVDVEKYLKELNFQVHIERQMNGSGKISNNDIFIDGSENKQRQRFSMAHELGHAMQNVRYANRNDNSNDYSSEDRQDEDEVFANAFAAQFLMPKVLVSQGISKAISDQHLDSGHLQMSEVTAIIKTVASQLDVSTMAMKYRIDNLGIFVPAEGK